jgi:hypothetical protein
MRTSAAVQAGLASKQARSESRARSWAMPVHRHGEAPGCVGPVDLLREPRAGDAPDHHPRRRRPDRCVVTACADACAKLGGAYFKTRNAGCPQGRNARSSSGGIQRPHLAHLPGVRASSAWLSKTLGRGSLKTGLGA